MPMSLEAGVVFIASMFVAGLLMGAALMAWWLLK